jgi:polysaccharide biosynthesis transport protein
MDSERELTLKDYLSVVKRKFPYAIVFFFLIFFAVVAAAIWISPVYQAKATILIESQQVTSDDTKEKYAAERFAALNQVVLSKDNLIKIAEKYKLYGLEKNPDLPREMLNAAMRGNVYIERLRAEPEGWEGASTFAFNISFTHYNPEETYQITNELVKLFLDENDRVSKEKVVGTAEFFSNEEAKRRVDLEKIEKEVTNYKRQYADSLPENKEMYIGSLERLENDLRVTQREYNATQAELRSLDVSLESAKAGVGVVAGQDRPVSPTDLDGLRLELAKQKSIYNDNHPAVRVLQRRVDELERNAAASVKSEPTKSVTAQSVMVAKVQAQIDTANSRLKSLRDEVKLRVG